MIEAIAEKRPAIKSFKRKAPEPIGNEFSTPIQPPLLEPEQPLDNVISFKGFKRNKVQTLESCSASSNNDPVRSFMADLETMVETQNQTMQKITPQSETGNITSFPTPRVIDWNEDKGRFALAENFLKQNQAEFMMIRQRMNAMADADGCGGVNERSGQSSNNLFGNKDIASIGGTNKAFGEQPHNHKEGNHKHCEKHDKDDCHECAA